MNQIQKNHTFILDISSGLVEFTGDFYKIRQILVNLLLNAIKFTPQSGQITLKLRDEEKYLIFNIIDTGIGIKQEDLIHLFEPFFQIKSNDKEITSGIGLGLYYTKLLVDLIHGDLTIESKPGMGSNFQVKILRN